MRRDTFPAILALHVHVGPFLLLSKELPVRPAFDIEVADRDRGPPKNANINVTNVAFRTWDQSGTHGVDKLVSWPYLPIGKNRLVIPSESASEPNPIAVYECLGPFRFDSDHRIFVGR